MQSNNVVAHEQAQSTYNEEKSTRETRDRLLALKTRHAIQVFAWGVLQWTLNAINVNWWESLTEIASDKKS